MRFLEDMMFAENPLCRRAGTEAMCNMLMNEEVFGFFATPKGAAWERVKLWILLSGVADEDLPTAVAASGGLAQLSHSPDVCKVGGFSTKKITSLDCFARIHDQTALIHNHHPPPTQRIKEEKQGIQIMKELLVCFCLRAVPRPSASANPPPPPSSPNS